MEYLKTILDRPCSIAVIIAYCVDGENNPVPAAQYEHRSTPSGGRSGATDSHSTSKKYHSHQSSHGAANSSNNTHQYTLADVPRLAEYSANVYASTTAEHDHYYKYYTEYYVNEITKGNFAGLPTINQIGETANSGAAVALSAIQRKQKMHHKDGAAGTSSSSGGASTSKSSQPLVLPTGRDNKKYGEKRLSNMLV